MVRSTSVVPPLDRSPRSRTGDGRDHIDIGAAGRDHLAVVIDCHDRERYRLSLRARAREAERLLEDACRFGDFRPRRPKRVVRSDNGLIVQNERFRVARRGYGFKLPSHQSRATRSSGSSAPSGKSASGNTVSRASAKPNERLRSGWTSTPEVDLTRRLATAHGGNSEQPT